MGKVFLDGRLVESDTVSQSLLSRGFAFGYGVFETIKFLEKMPCYFAEHLGRLGRALAGSGLKVELVEPELRRQARELFEAEDVNDGVFKIVISDSGSCPTVAMFVRSRGMPEEPAPSRLLMSKVVKASQAFTSRHKSLNYMESVLELENAKAAGFSECVFRNEDGYLTECAVANLFLVQEGVLKTPALECGLLDGIVRGKVIEIARDRGLVVEEGAFVIEDLLSAQEAFLTSSGGGPRAVESFQSLGGESVKYAVELLPGLREAYLNRERGETSWSHV